jgi:hypothetical protein
MEKNMTLQEFIYEIKQYNKYWNLKRRVERRLKDNKNHRKERIRRIIKRKMKHIK